MTGRAHGYCCQCNRHRTGRIVGEVEQNSGPGQTIIICDECSVELRKKLHEQRHADLGPSKAVSASTSASDGDPICKWTPAV